LVDRVGAADGVDVVVVGGGGHRLPAVAPIHGSGSRPDPEGVNRARDPTQGPRAFVAGLRVR